MVDWNKGECYQELEFKLRISKWFEEQNSVSDKFEIIFSL